jgi:hypothetical protein
MLLSHEEEFEVVKSEVSGLMAMTANLGGFGH